MAEATYEGRVSHQLPSNLEVERALLGCLILDNPQIEVVLEVLPSAPVQEAMAPPEARRRPAEMEPLFFSPAHQFIFSSICHLYQTGNGVDITTLSEELARRGNLETVGGADYLSRLEDDIFSLAQVPQYAQILGQKWRLRRLIRAAHAIADEASTSEAATEDIIESSEKRIFEISQEQQKQDFVCIGDALVNELQEIERRAKHGGEMPGLATGFAELDRMTTGFRAAQLLILAARPSMGKTALALNIASHVAMREQRPVGVFSLEMSVSELTTRMLCTEAHVSMGRVRGNFTLRRDEIEALHEAGERMASAPIYIDDGSSLTALELRARARRLKKRYPNLGLLVVDYLQLMHSGAARVESRQQEVSEISRGMKMLARELEVPILALSQLSRQSEQRRGKDKLPRLSDLRESGAIEQDADMVMFIHREPNMQTGENDESQPQMATLRIGKQRNGPIGDIDLLFLGQYTQFVNVKQN